MDCPFCDHPKSHKHGKTSQGSQRFRCASCGRAFTETIDTLYYRRQVTPEQVEMILQAHAEGSSLRGISRIGKRAYGTVNDWGGYERVFTAEITHIMGKENTAKKTVREIAQQMSHDCVARRLRQVNRALTRLYDEALRPHGLTINQLNILAVIISEKQIQPGQLGQALGMEKSTVSRTIDRMAKKNWIQIASGEDSRTQLLSATPKGRQLMLAVTPIWNTLQESVLSSRNDQNILQMLALGTAPTLGAQTEIQDREVPLSADDFYL